MLKNENNPNNFFFVPIIISAIVIMYFIIFMSRQGINLGIVLFLMFWIICILCIVIFICSILYLRSSDDKKTSIVHLLLTLALIFSISIYMSGFIKQPDYRLHVLNNLFFIGLTNYDVTYDFESEPNNLLAECINIVDRRGYSDISIISDQTYSSVEFTYNEIEYRFTSYDKLSNEEIKIFEQFNEKVLLPIVNRGLNIPYDKRKIKLTYD